MRVFEKVVAVLNKILLVLGAIAVMSLMSIATINVVFRLAGGAIPGAYEIVAYLGAIVIAFALGITQQEKDHIIVDIVTEKFSKKANKILDTVNYVITMIFFSIVAWQIYVWGVKILRTGEVSETLRMIYYPFIFGVAIGFATLSLTLLRDFINNVTKREEA